MKRLIIGISLIIIVTIVNFNEDEIYYQYQIYKLKNSYEVKDNNDYYYNYHFSYVKDSNKINLENITDIKNTIYTLLNSGNTSITRYCDKLYKTCIDDIKNIANDEDFLSYINSFVHPYNSFDTITFDFDGNIGLEIKYKKIYNEDEIIQIEKFVDGFINDYITDNMSDLEKIKTVHDYIIKNTKYDNLKTIDILDDTYKSNTAYGVLFEGYGICSGYSDALAIFLYKLGFTNYKISNDKHIWNLVLLNDKWYHIDLTWDDPVYINSDKQTIEYDYFLKTTKELESIGNEDHKFDKTIYIEAN